MRRDEYLRTGGHAMVRRELFEDTTLARAWRAAGRSGLCVDGQDVVRVRMYDSLEAIWAGFQKNVYPAFRHEASFWLFLRRRCAPGAGPIRWPRQRGSGPCYRWR
ncbi:MAG: hypothetical protein FJ221_15170 [Lentisphaerae bacterium]|nr:hypothetical protein [Lentisphaerota bacterium]